MANEITGLEVNGSSINVKTLEENLNAINLNEVVYFN